jgi:hypothetical protein
MNVIQEYTQALLLPRLRSLSLSKRQQEIVVKDVSQRLESLLSHWSDLAFRRTILFLGTEEASFWEPYTARLEIRSLVVVTIRNSLIEDLGASHPCTEMLKSRKKQLRDEEMPAITSEATRYFETANFDAVRFQPEQDLFGDLPRRFPNAWHALSLLSASSENEIACELPIVEAESMETWAPKWEIQQHSVVATLAQRRRRPAFWPAAACRARGLSVGFASMNRGSAPPNVPVPRWLHPNPGETDHHSSFPRAAPSFRRRAQRGIGVVTIYGPDGKPYSRSTISLVVSNWCSFPRRGLEPINESVSRSGAIEWARWKKFAEKTAQDV